MSDKLVKSTYMEKIIVDKNLKHNQQQQELHQSLSKQQLLQRKSQRVQGSQ